MRKIIQDVKTMSARCLKMSFRNAETLVGSAITPMMMVFLFIYLLSTGAHDRQAFINAQVPSVIVVTLGFSASYTAFSVNSDMKKGIIDRFRSMPLFQPAVLTGHVVASLARSIITMVVVIGAALVVGFRPEAGIFEWMASVGILLLVALVLTWVSVLLGLISETPEGASAYSMIIQFLPFLSAGFAEPEHLMGPLRIFFQHQPFTPIIEAIRGLTMGAGDGRDIIAAVIWCAVLIISFYIPSVCIYNRGLNLNNS